MARAYSLQERREMKNGAIYTPGTQVSAGEALIIEHLYRIIELLEKQDAAPTIIENFRTLQALAE
jgi:hypothetical protein